MKPFREFYKDRHDEWPGIQWEPYDHIFKRLCEAFADYADEMRKEHEARNPEALK